MKKSLSLIIALSMLILALVSCGQVVESTTDITFSTENNPSNTDHFSSSNIHSLEPTPSKSNHTAESVETSTTHNEPHEPHTYKPEGYALTMIESSRAFFVETSSKIIFWGNVSAVGKKSYVYYYSKADGEFYPFCFDPLCQHKDIWDGDKYVGTTCVAKMLYLNNGTRIDAYTPPQYCNGRIYFVYFDEIWSCNEYATDIRIDVSFSKLPSNITKTEIKKRMESGISCFNQFLVGGNSVYFDHLDADGKVRYYRFDTEMRKLHDLSEEMEALAKDLGLESLAFQYAVGNYIRFGGINPNTKKIEYIVTDQNLNITSIPFLGENDTLSIIRNTANGQLCGIRRFDKEHNLVSVERIEVLPNGEYKLIHEETAEVFAKGARFYVTDDYVYESGGESVFLGYSGYVSVVTGEAEKVINPSNGIVRYNKKTGEKELIFQDDWLNCDKIYYVNDETGEFLAKEKRYYKGDNDTVSGRSNLLYSGKIVNGKLENYDRVSEDD